MFTGIVTNTGEVKSVHGKRVEIALPFKSKKGQSIAINGACLTITSAQNGAVFFDLSEETIARTNLGILVKGEKVNLELSIKPIDRIDGHFVTGHVDCTGKARLKGSTLEVRYPKKFFKLVAPKGSVTVDGVSLTVVKSNKGLFTCELIPYTLQVTTLKKMNKERLVNIEFDLIAKYINHILTQ